MTELNLGESKITHRQQIIQLLKLAMAQQWDFAYLVPQKNRVATHEVKLVSVNTDNGTFSIDSEIERSGEEEQAAIMFRVQSGGLSVMFKSRVADPGETENESTPPRGFQINLPYEVSCTQLRKSARVNMEHLDEQIPVVLYLAMGVRVNGTLIDISTSGAKFRATQDLTEKCKNLQVLDACRIELPGDFVLQTGAQLIGMTYDGEGDASYLRCQFSDMRGTDEDRLEEFVNRALDSGDANVRGITG